MNFKNNEKNEKIIQIMKKNGARSIIYWSIFVFLLIGYESILNRNPPFIIFPIIIILIAHFLSIRFIPKKKQKLLNYAPIWSSVSVAAFILIYISDTFLIGEKVARGVGVIGLGVLWFVAMGMAEKMTEDE